MGARPPHGARRVPPIKEKLIASEIKPHQLPLDQRKWDTRGAYKWRIVRDHRAMSLHNPLSRRRLITGLGAGAAGLVAGPLLVGSQSVAAVPRPGAPVRLPSNLFTLGVASGDPEPDGFVLWTRLAPAPLDGGGMPNRPIPVEWQVAEDATFARIRARGRVLAGPALGHSVHVEVNGLAPDRVYHYRFRAAREISPVGRTRTAPAIGARPSRLRFAYASCQDYQAGAYTPYQHLQHEDIAFVAFLGDYIYESKPVASPRKHVGIDEPYTLGDYRNRHAQYKTDPDLQAVHAAVPWVVTFDDHELDNNWAGAWPQDPHLQPAAAFRARRRAAFQAYYEHMPLRRSSLPRGLDMHLYRRFRFGQLASLHVLDTRQYRSRPPMNLAEAEDPARTLTGATQERWLTQGMSDRPATWNLLANQVMWATNDRTAGPEQTYDFDNWDGYRVQRRRMLEFFGSGRTSNPVVLTGDRHATWVCDLRANFEDPASRVVGAELTCSSVTSGGDASVAAFHAQYDPIMAESPHWKYIDNRRGYMVCEVTPEELTASLRVVSTVWQPTATISTGARFRVEAGRPGVEVIDHGPVI
jgi:alkaline phosphatase D